MKYVLLIDGDNTLWDSDRVFLRAQEALIEVLRNRGVDLGPAPMKILRETDLELASQVGTFEYNFALLGRALVLASRGQEVREAATKAVRSTTIGRAPIWHDWARDAAAAMATVLEQEMPPLLTHAEELLSWLTKERKRDDRRLAVYLVSEGLARRIDRVVRHHQLDGGNTVFDGIRVLPRKTAPVLMNVVEEGRRLLDDQRARVLSLGDSLRRDVVPGNQIGAMTIYKPANFFGREEPKGAEQAPNYEVRDLGEALALIKSLIKHDRRTA